MRYEVARFLAELRDAPAPCPQEAEGALSTERGGSADAPAHLLFALDATMSRQPTWDMAVAIQAEMFLEAAKFGGLAIKLVYFRGLDECRATGFVTDPVKLAELMTRISCRAGRTQIRRVLSHAVTTARKQGLRAMVHVGDCCEENPDTLAAIAGELAILGVPAFFFHEGSDAFAAAVFAELARITGGAALPFDATSPHELSALLKGVAVYAAGGTDALRRLAKREMPARALLAHLGSQEKG
ncbi:MAG: VWA domain-containing protein [Alphaproteobacteria bacterium]|nr:MAG: VWA domain-containing protein [Alphaproteobacteria bacterium]